MLRPQPVHVLAVSRGQLIFPPPSSISAAEEAFSARALPPAPKAVPSRAAFRPTADVRLSVAEAAVAASATAAAEEERRSQESTL